MKFFSIEVPLDENNTKEYLENQLIEINNENINTIINSEETDECFIIKASITFSNIDIAEVNKKLAAPITAVLFSEYYKGMVKRILKTQYGYLDIDDIINIKDKVNKIIQQGCSIEKGIIRDSVFHIIYEYVCENDEMKLKGFVMFRLKEFYNYLQDEIEKIVDEVFMEKEYNEFIRLLRYFVEIQDPKTEVINVLPYMAGYKLYDEDFNEINSHELLDLGDEISEASVSSDDLLISWLITAAPLKIVLHNREMFSKQLLETVQNVFLNRVEICDGCERCNINNHSFNLGLGLEDIKNNFKNFDFQPK